MSDREARLFLDAHDLAGCGVAWVDVDLLAAARLARATLLTADRALHRAAVAAGAA